MLPHLIAQGLEEKGITNLTPPQVEALASGLLDGVNIVVVAPTASGKTLIGEIALVNMFLKNRKGLYTTPLKALAYEKYEEFKFWERYGVKVGISVGDYVVTQEEVNRLENYDIIVTTYERLDSILRKRPRWISDVGVIVIDELHMLGDESRGHIVEMIAIRAKLFGIQIVGLSATIGNPEELAEWLNAKLVRSDWRPVRLFEVPTYRSGRSWTMMMPKDLAITLVSPPAIQVDDVTKYWILRAIREGFNVLEFKYSRKAVEELAHSYAPVVCENLPEDLKRELESIARQLKDQLHDFEFEKLYPLIRCGVSYHHAGLSHSARRFIEQAFRERLLKYLAATPTLAMGVNMPARVVILNVKYFSEGSTKRLGILEYKQLAGRAGRPQYDPYGIVVIGKDLTRYADARSYIEGVPEGISSKLLEESALRKHVLSVIASAEATTFRDLVKFFGASFCASKLSRNAFEEKIRSTIALLEELSMIKRINPHSENAAYTVTKLGATTSWLYIDPITSFTIIAGLAGKDSVLPDIYYLSLIGMTPDFSDIHISRYAYEWYEELIYDYELRGEVPPQSLEYNIRDPEVSWVRGCLIGLILRDWIEEVPERTIIERYGIELGDLTVIRETAEWLLYSASVITDAIAFNRHSKKFSILLERTRHGVKEDALELAQLKYVGRVRARRLVEAGIKNIKDVIEKEPTVLKLLGEGWGKKIVEEAKKYIQL